MRGRTCTQLLQLATAHKPNCLACTGGYEWLCYMQFCSGSQVCTSGQELTGFLKTHLLLHTLPCTQCHANNQQTRPTAKSSTNNTHKKARASRKQQTDGLPG
jgi:hypothetical protein